MANLRGQPLINRGCLPSLRKMGSIPGIRPDRAEKRFPSARWVFFAMLALAASVIGLAILALAYEHNQELARAQRETALNVPHIHFNGASGNVAAGDLPADLHRVNLGIGILRPHRRRGLGRRLMASIFDWCRKQPSVAWLDLGVFSDNEPAIALYEHLGFTTIGRVTDRWRVDGRRIDEIRMTCRVGDGEPA